MSGNLNKTFFFLLLKISISSTHLKNPGILNCIRLILSQIAIKMGLTCKHQIFELAFPIYLPLFCGMGRWNMSKVLDLIAKGSHMSRRSHTDCFFFLSLFSLSPSFSLSRCPINNGSRQALVLYQCHSSHNWQTPIVIFLMYLFQFCFDI